MAGILLPDEVHLWRIPLDDDARLVAADQRPLLETDPSADAVGIQSSTVDTHCAEGVAELSPAELARAGRFHFERDRRRFLRARRALRAIVADYLGTVPGAIEFQYGGQGKPRVAVAPPLYFNLSHSQALALLAMTRLGEIGVDVEWIRPIELEIADRYFAPAEVAALRALPAAEQTAAFFRCWTRKEAYIKARGEGVLLPLDGFEVSLAPGDPAALLRVREDDAEAQRWQFEHLEPAPGYVGAMALRARGWRLRDQGWWAGR